LIDHTQSNEAKNTALKSDFDIYRNRKSNLNESILVHFNHEERTYTLHVYALMLVDDDSSDDTSKIIDLRKGARKVKSPLKAVASQKKGSLSFIRYFIKDPKEKKYEQKLKV